MKLNCNLFTNELFLLVLCSFLLPGISVSAQQSGCGFDDLIERNLKENPRYLEMRDEIEKQTKDFISHHTAVDRSVTTISIPVVVHVVYFNNSQNISDAEISSQINVLNADFRRLNSDAINTPAPFQSVAADCEINFCLATLDPNGNPTNGIERRQTDVNGFLIAEINSQDPVSLYSQGGLDSWDNSRYLNIWVFDILDDFHYKGYCWGVGSSTGTDGVFIDYLSFSGTNHSRTLTHEVGHWANLYHIFGGLTGNISSCTDSDMVDDTPNQDVANFFCPAFPTISCNNGPNGDMFMNYMDYTDDNCKNLFTFGQKSRMLALFAPGGFRASFNCENTCGQNPFVNTEITTNTLYNTNMSMAGDIYVRSGAELIIEATIGMRSGRRILVERNARLIIRNGGKVTRLCADWTGIQVLGNNQKAQPEFSAPLTDANQAGIVWIDNGIIEWARTGITAGGGYGPEYWGGVIKSSNNTLFQNNRKDVEFMSYKNSPNKSRFSNTSFIEAGNAFANTEGVTIWETDGIEFQNCTFKNKDKEGIRTFDAAVTIINNNQFENNDVGIYSNSTYPMSGKIKIGSGNTAENIFKNNHNGHIYAFEIGGLSDFSLDVINNNFIGGNSYGIAVDGASDYRVAGNLFDGCTYGTVVQNTGFNNLFNQNFIGCNSFKISGGIGVVALGENREMQILNNIFQMSGNSYDFLLNGGSGQNGSIRAIQGEKDKPAANCFTNPGVQLDLVTLLSTTSFKYYYQDGVPPAGCHPKPLTNGNYVKQGVLGGQAVVDCNQFGGLPHELPYPTITDLNIRRTTLQQLAPYIATDENSLNQYYVTLQEKDAILRYLVIQSLASGQYTNAEGLLMGEQSKAANWAIFGIRMFRKDYSNAAAWLNQLPIQNEEDQKFRDVQLINLQRLQYPSTFQLSAPQESFLNTIAEGTSAVRGYARGILGIMKDRRFYPDVINTSNGYSSPSFAGELINNVERNNLFRVFPVPSSTLLTVSWPALSVESDAHLVVYDIYGRQQINEKIEPFESERSIETSQLPVGVYWLVISEQGKPIHQSKFSVQR